MATTHRFSLASQTPQHSCKGGSRTDGRVQELPVLKGMSLSLLELQPKAVREPHWHPNANELNYCLEGSGMITVFSPGNNHDTFTIAAGEIAFIPRNFLHHIENTGTTPLRLVVCFDHEDPEDLGLSAGVSVMSPSLLADTFGVDAAFFEELRKTKDGIFISQRETAAKPPLPFMTNRFKLTLEANSPQVEELGGFVKMSNSFLMPTLQGLSVYSVFLNQSGGREPHWHPNADELNYLVSGSARITLLSPGGHVDTFDMKAGDMSFLPSGYLHSIENTGTSVAHFVIFFNHTAPSDIGFSGCLGAYSNEVLASLFGVSPKYFEKLPKLQKDLLIVGGKK